MEQSECGVDLTYFLKDGPLNGRKVICNSVRPCDGRGIEAQAQEWYRSKGLTVGECVVVHNGNSQHKYRISDRKGWPSIQMEILLEFVATIGSCEVCWEETSTASG